MEKYYTPELSEFYDGFEYELLEVRGKMVSSIPAIKEWVKDVFSIEDWCYTFFVMDNGKINPESIRVKFLDVEDLKELLFQEEFIPNIFSEDDELTKGFVKYIDKNNSINLFYENGRCMIYKQSVYNEHSGNWTAQILFDGKIKNKSELKNLLSKFI